MGKIILDLCGGTGSWSKPYVEAGYDVRLVTYPNNDVRTYEPPPGVYGILAAPPCTMFSLARRNAKLPPDLAGATEVVGACFDIVWKCRAEGSLKFWAMENPVGLLRQFIGAPKMTFEPWWYGAKKTKRTDLWGYFNVPRRTILTKPDDIGPSDLAWQSPRAPEGYEHMALDRAAIRAITPPAFAQAFFKANR
jgi:hypothetical protein